MTREIIHKTFPVFKSHIVCSLVLIMMCGLLSELQAQNYNFSLSQSQQTYTCINNGVTLDNTRNWTIQKKYLPFGFHFNYQGGTYDSLLLQPNGQISFDGTTKTCISIMNGLKYKQDSLGKSTAFRYKTVGNIGQRIFMMEMAGAGLNMSQSEYINAQLWLYEQNGGVEFHFGPNSYSAQSDSTGMVVVGPINWQMNGTKNGYLLNGAPGSVVGVPIVSGLQFITSVPPSNSVYTLIPNQ